MIDPCDFRGVFVGMVADVFWLEAEEHISLLYGLLQVFVSDIA